MSLDHKASFVKPQLTSFDNFLDAKLNIEQPIKGFRSGIDAILLAASVNDTNKNFSNQHLLELGSGVGVASLGVLVFNENLSATLLDMHEDLIGLANKNISLNNMNERASAIKFDILASSLEREKAGIKQNYYSHIIANPPYFDCKNGTLAKGELRSTARHMAKENLDIWVKMAASCAQAGATAIFIYKAEGLSELLQSFEKRFGNIKILPISSRSGQSAARFLISGVLGSRAPLELKSTLTLHKGTGRDFLPEVEKIFRGEKTLNW